MRKALSLARRTWPSPNPRVGAIIVKDGVIVGRGRHLHYGGAHAEVYALQKAGQKAYSATVYVTLEPCSHHGRTGPCAEALIEAGVSRVVAGCIDPNPNVAGQGVAMLRAAGIDVVTGVEEERARRLIAGHARFMTVGLPYVVWKYAMSLDGKVATSSGESRWVTGEQSRREVHRMRCNADAVVIGIGTALTDDPELTVRGVVDNHQPKRVVFDSNGRLPLQSRLLNSPGGAVIVVVSSNCPQANQRRLQDAGASVVSAGESRVDVRQALQMLANHFDIREILL
ncbi:MAG: bifunctional diaminohydroxyphosphoribosylaminopyrimidine deaminase/5-amino-6-(5-phosphoribosylamino)uracil reductase RibD, partial [Armatimonadota bacterium]